MPGHMEYLHLALEKKCDLFCFRHRFFKKMIILNLPRRGALELLSENLITPHPCLPAAPHHHCQVCIEKISPPSPAIEVCLYAKIYPTLNCITVLPDCVIFYLEVSPPEFNRASSPTQESSLGIIPLFLFELSILNSLSFSFPLGILANTLYKKQRGKHEAGKSPRNIHLQQRERKQGI